jgi:hypothetical protein
MGVTLDGFPPEKVATVERVRKLVKPVLDSYSDLAGVPQSFWGALTINETGPWIIHNLVVPKRFEQGVLAKLTDVLYGQRTTACGMDYDAIVRAMATERLKDIASSHGLTQIMGYHAVLRSLPIADLNDPAKHYTVAARVMKDFLRQYQLDPVKNAPEMAHCWNSGSPHGKTYDPLYESNLMVRKAIWEALDETKG